MTTDPKIELQAALDEFLNKVAKLKVEHETAIQHILKEIDERKLQATRDKLKQLSYDQ